jgi:hypothetical protein
LASPQQSWPVLCGILNLLRNSENDLNIIDMKKALSLFKDEFWQDAAVKVLIAALAILYALFHDLFLLLTYGPEAQFPIGPNLLAIASLIGLLVIFCAEWFFINPRMKGTFAHINQISVNNNGFSTIHSLKEIPFSAIEKILVYTHKSELFGYTSLHMIVVTNNSNTVSVDDTMGNWNVLIRALENELDHVNDLQGELKRRMNEHPFFTKESNRTLLYSKEKNH